MSEPPEEEYRPGHPLTPRHLARAREAAERVRRGMPRIMPQIRSPFATPPPGVTRALPVESADELHARFCEACGGRLDAEGFVAALMRRLGIKEVPPRGPDE